MDVRVGLWRKLSAKELMFLNCGIGEDSWGSFDCKEIQPVHSKRDQSWVFFGRNDAKAKTLVLRSPDVKNWLIWKDPDAGKDWRQEEKGTTEDEIVGWHHWLNGHESDVSSVGQGSYDGQGSVACCSLWRCKELDMTEWLNWTDIPVGLSHCSSGIVCNLIITKLIMGYAESSAERGNLDKCCNSPCEKQHYLELWVVALYRDQIEMNLNCIL